MQGVEQEVLLGSTSGGEMDGREVGVGGRVMAPQRRPYPWNL